MAYGDGWIGRDAPAAPPVLRSIAEPSLVVRAAHSALGVVYRLQVRVGELPVLVREDGPEPGEPAYEVCADLDLPAHLAVRLDLAGREDEAAPPERWEGALAAGRYHALRGADPDDSRAVAELAGAAGCPVELVRAAAAPVSLSRVEVVRRDGAGRPTGPTAVTVDELAWIDGGPHGLWTVRPGEPDLDGAPTAVTVRRGCPAEVAAELTRMVRAGEGC